MVSIISSIDGIQFANMIISASNHLDNNKTAINTLNVFPVPDGDTGTNMSLTFSSAAEEIKKFVTPSVCDVAKSLSTASLRGARGNSGVILSQFCRGIALSLENKQIANAKELASALKSGVDTAYKAVMRPTEGTILTVAREGAAAAVKSAETEDDITVVFSNTINAAKEALDNTPNLLPVLKEAGVVDAGGAGLVKILEGAYHALLTGTLVDLAEAVKNTTSVTAQAVIDTENIKFAYCTEFIIDKKSSHVNVKRFSEVIDPKGDCKLVIDDDEIVKVHIHTNNPGFVIEEALKIGSLSRIKIDNMKLQHTTILESETVSSKNIKSKTDGTLSQNAPRKPYGFVCVTSGNGLAAVFRNYGADEIIEGGQTMNPSTDDILNAIEKINAECIFVLPNNKNIILAANQAADLCERNIIVLPSTTAPQGIAAMMAFLPHLDAEENAQAMTNALESVKTGQVTYAVRDTSVSGREIKTGDIIGISDGEICSVAGSPNEVLYDLIKRMSDEYSEVISVYYGEDITDAQAQTAADKLEEIFPDCDVLLQPGGQPLYYYIVSVE